MVAHGVSRNKIHGSGLIDNLLIPFTAKPRFEGERHAISQANETRGVAMNWMGPFTSIASRTNPDLSYKSDSIPINNSDLASYNHDIAYFKAKQNYEQTPTTENKKIQMKKVYIADNVFINKMENDRQEPMAKIAGKLIQGKEFLEKTGVLQQLFLMGLY